MRIARPLIGWTLLLLATGPALAETKGEPAGDPTAVYDEAMARITPDVLKACERMAMETIANQVRVGANIDWDAPMAAGETGRLISTTWAERVGPTEGTLDPELSQTYLLAITGRVTVRPKTGTAFTAVPVCWFDYLPSAGTPELRAASLRGRGPVEAPK